MSGPDILATLRIHLADQYDVEGQIGEGGMATVYRAHDQKHGRDVAIKVLKSELAASIGRDRFLQEITIAARLQHPHVLPVYDSGDADGVLYYVMPFVEGESLRERIDRGEISTNEALRIVREVASALDYAHRENVVHRDIKPANILLSQGHAVVADFGIARAAATPDQTQTPGLTQVGTSVGTPWYMSPEQATADPDLDGRSDIFSLGCVLFELLEGRPPFEGDSVPTIIAQTISAPTPDLDRSATRVPGSIRDALRRALEKNPDKRFTTAGEFERALENVTGEISSAVQGSGRRNVLIATAAILIAFVGGFVLRSSPDNDVMSEAQVIAVLPFDVSGASTELGEGMVNLLSTNLNAVGQIRMVDSRTVLQRWRTRGGAKGLDLETSLQVGRDVEAGSVLLGNIVSLGANVRITADLYSVDGEQLANVQLDGSADGTLMLVDSLSLGILQAIWRSNAPMPSFDVAAITSNSIEAIRAYMRGSLHYRHGTWDSARVAFLEAVEADTTFALAYFALSETIGWTGQHGSDIQREAIARAAANADRLPPRERLLVSGYELYRNGDMTSIDTLERYTRVYPSDARGWYALGDFRFHDLARLALNPEEQFEAFDRAVALDSAYTAALIHPMEIALIHGTEEQFSTYLRLTEEAGGDDQGHRLVANLIWGNAEEKRNAADSLVNADTFMVALGAALVANPDIIDLAIKTVSDALPDLPPQNAVGVNFALAIVSLASGRLETVDAFVERFGPDDTTPLQGLAAIVRILATTGGIRDAEYAAPGIAWFEKNQPGFGAEFIRAVVALTEKDSSAAQASIAVLEGTETTPRRAHLLIGLQGWAALTRGDTAAAIPLLRRAADSIPTPRLGGDQLTNSFKFMLAQVLAADPDTYEEGMRLLRWGFPVQGAPEVLPASHLAVANAAERANDIPGAIEALADFIALWNGASDELQPQVADARARLAALQERNR